MASRRSPMRSMQLKISTAFCHCPPAPTPQVSHSTGHGSTDPAVAPKVAATHQCLDSAPDLVRPALTQVKNISDSLYGFRAPDRRDTLDTSPVVPTAG